MARPPKSPSRFVNLRGEPIDLRRLGQVGRKPADSAPAVTAPPAPLPAVPAADIEAVFDALCLSGTPRGKTWLLHFLRATAPSSRGVQFTVGEIDAALAALRAMGRIKENVGIGFEVPPAVLGPRRNALLLDGRHQTAWQAWARASTGASAFGAEPPPAQFRHEHDMLAYAKLLLYGGLKLADYSRAAGHMLRPQGVTLVLARTVLDHFEPALWAAMDPALRDELLQAFVLKLDMSTPTWAPLLQWLDAQAVQQPATLSPPLRMVVAVARLHRGELPGVAAMLESMAGAGVTLMRAASLAMQGQWAEAATAFATGLKEGATADGIKRGLAPFKLLQWYLWSLLAQPQPLLWTQARKLCVTESGSRKPLPFNDWGLCAHAIAVRLGDEPLQQGLLDHERWPNSHDVEQNALRLVFAAWLGQRPKGYTAAITAQIVRGLHAGGQPVKADLVRQACARLGLAVPAREAADGAPWPVEFFGPEREAWRDALAAIEALGGGPARKAEPGVAATLEWRITLDDEQRVIAVQPFERSVGVRGPGKAKAVSLSKVKKSLRLDPRDAAVARCIDDAHWGHGLAIDVVGAAIALVNHPAVFLDDAPGQAVELREAMPLLEVQRQRDATGAESFVFHLADALAADSEADIGEAFTSNGADAESERRETLRIFRDSPDRARLVRINPAQRRVAELVSQRWAVPVEAKAELDAALRVLAGHFQLHSDAEAGQAVPGEPRLRAQLSPVGDSLQLRLLVQPFGSFGPAVRPGHGRARLITLHEGLSLSTERDLAAENAHLAAVFEALPFLAEQDGGDASWLLDDPEEALHTIEKLPTLPAIAGLDWPKGKPVRVTVLPTGAMKVSVGSGVDWFAVDGEVRVDEQRVLGLQQLMQMAHESRSGRYVALGDGEYLALTERLRQQLADLQALAQTDKNGLRLPVAAASWLAEALEGSELAGDAPWRQRIKRLNAAAALQPEPPAALQAQLRSYQAEGYAWMVRLAHAGLGACLADDMGLGKTVQTLGLLLNRGALGPALVVAPTSVCGNWAAEAARFAPTLRVQVYGEGERAATLAQAGPYDLVVVSYALVQIEAEAFAAREWATLVLDEAQALKNAATKRAKAVSALRADFRLALTGTPVENRLGDLWSLMNLLNPGLLGSSGQFGERFANLIEKPRDDPADTGQRRDDARQRLRRLVAPFLLRRTKAQVLSDLPPRTEIVHRIEPGPEERHFLEASRREALARVAAMAQDTGAGQATFHVLAELTRLRRAACDPRLVAPELGLIGAKAQEFEQLAVELVAGRHKALVFSQFTDFLKLLAERLQSAGIAYQYLDGSTPAAERTKRVDAFQRGEGDLFLISLKAGGFGLNLTAADYVIITDPWWNPAAEDQAMGRAHRIGQQRPVTVYRLVTAGSIEERIVELHHSKRQLADSVLEGQDQGRPIGAEELAALLRG